MIFRFDKSIAIVVSDPAKKPGNRFITACCSGYNGLVISIGNGTSDGAVPYIPHGPGQVCSWNTGILPSAGLSKEGKSIRYKIGY